MMFVTETDPYAPPAEIAPVVAEFLASGELKNPVLLSKWTIGLLLLSQLLDLGLHVWGTLAWSEELEALSSLAWMPFYLAYVVMFLCWSYRILWNAHEMSPEVMTVSPGWGVGSYFVPIMNFWIPLKALLQASRASEINQGLLLIWWIGGFAVVGLYVVYLLLYGDGLDSGYTWADHAIVAWDLVRTALEVIIVLGFTRAQVARMTSTA